MTITLRTDSTAGATTKGAPLTWSELDGNFEHFMSSAGSSSVGFVQSGTGATATDLQTHLRSYAINAKTFAGAKGDGTTDDASAIQKAINAAIALTGGAVYLPQGRYYCGSTITIANCGQLTIFGDGGKLSSELSVGQDMRGAVFLNKVAGVLFSITDTQTTSGGRRTENLVFDGIGVEQFNSTSDIAFQIGPTTTSSASYPHHIRFKNGGVYNGKYGVQFTGNGVPFDIAWEDFDLDGMSSGVYVPDRVAMPNGDFLQLRWTRCRMNTCTRYAVEAYQGNSFYFYTNRIEANTLGGLFLKGVTAQVLEDNHFELNGTGTGSGDGIDVLVQQDAVNSLFPKTLTCRSNTYTRDSAHSQAVQFKCIYALSQVYENEQFTGSGGTASLQIAAAAGGQNAVIIGGIFDTAYSIDSNTTYSYFPRTGGLAFSNINVSGNYLDWYEEGTWTPAVNFGGATTGIAYSWDVGTFQRVGNIVTAACGLALSNKGSASGAATLAGLPYAAASGNDQHPAAEVYYANFPAGMTTSMLAVGNASSSSLNFYKLGGAGTPTAMADTDFQSNSQVNFVIRYRVA